MVCEMKELLRDVESSKEKESVKQVQRSMIGTTLQAKCTLDCVTTAASP